MDSTPVVSIICLTFNHEKYLRQCLESFLMQKTDFPFEVLVNDDASSDGTVAILKEYQKRYPDIIKVLFHEKNQYSDPSCGHHQILANLFEIARGKYFAFCEGDDFWSDESKLQSQVAFLNQNLDYVALYHNVNIINQNNESVEHGGFFKNLKEHECELSIFSKKGQIGGQLSSLMCRNFWREFSETEKKGLLIL